MEPREVATVRWGALHSRAALYGTAVTRDPSGEVRLVNPLMPSGTAVQKWHSTTDYQALRDSPALPLLHQGRRYRLDPTIRTEPPDTAIFEVRCFDRFDRLLGARVLHPPEFAFDFPDDCHHYTIRLLNGGCDELRFTSFRLIEMTPGREPGKGGATDAEQ